MNASQTEFSLPRHWPTASEESLRAEIAALHGELADATLEPWQESAIRARLREVEQRLAALMEEGR